MESRKITVLVEATQKKYVLLSSATKLSELKEELAQKGVTTNDSDSFKESRSKSILTSPESVLPTNIPWKGGITNELVFMISKAERKIKLGMKSRNEIVALIKSYGLLDEVKKKTGKNYTNVSTAVLSEIVDKYELKARAKVKDISTPKGASTTKSAPNVEKSSKKSVKSTPSCDCAVKFKKAVDSLYKENLIDYEVKDFLYEVIEGKDVNIDDISSYADLAEEFDF
jgi:hypothetical protein